MIGGLFRKGPVVRREPRGDVGVKRIMRILVALLLLASASVAASPSTQPAVDEKCRALLVRWQDRFADEHLTYLVSPPFVLAGDGGIIRLRKLEALTVRDAADALQDEFFDAKPADPILILLFESDGPYRRLSKKWFGNGAASPYGYFRRDNIMVMNVATGTGTLVHELTHALIKPDFPKVPDWFNEGLGSLFEQCTLASGKIRGLPNWRLPALQRAIKQDKLRPIVEMIKDDEFYGEAHVGLNYAQARYLLYYFQEHNQLADFYKKLRANQKTDPAGLATFKEMIAPQLPEEFESHWRTWVLKLQYP